MCTAGFIHGAAEHHLDHLAPLCSLLDLPLIVTEHEIEALAHKYYPGVRVRMIDHRELPFTVSQEFETILTTLPRDLFDQIFFFAEKLLGKKIKTVWCPHGNSDKGHASEFMEALQKETRALVYGQKMVDFLEQKGALGQLQEKVLLGNYRKQFAGRHKKFYAGRLEEKLKLNKKNRTILFAPTWEDVEKSSSFFSMGPRLIEQLPSHLNLIIKPHPNLKWQREGAIFELLESCARKPNLFVLWDFPPIYPLLEMVDIYLGDMSSIGYDFLSFDRPLFFLNPNGRDPSRDAGLFLFRCGQEIPPDAYHRLYDFIEERAGQSAQFSSIRQEVYAYTFGEEKSEEILKDEILKLVR